MPSGLAKLLGGKAKKAKRPVPVRALRTQSKIGGTGAILSVQTARIVERRYKVMALRRQGVPIHEVAELLGNSPATIRDDIQQVLGALATAMFEGTEEDRNLERFRMDSLLQRYQPLAEAGNLAAASLVLAISDRRRKLLSLDIPEKKSEETTAIRVYVGVDIDAV